MPASDINPEQELRLKNGASYAKATMKHVSLVVVPRLCRIDGADGAEVPGNASQGHPSKCHTLIHSTVLAPSTHGTARH
jgi:hypothetical protein